MSSTPLEDNLNPAAQSARLNRARVLASSDLLRLSFSRLRRKLSKAGSFSSSHQVMGARRIQLQLRAQISADLARFSILVELSETKTQRMIALDLENLSFDETSGIVMQQQLALKFSKPSHFRWLQFLQDQAWIDLPIESLDEWVECFYATPIRPSLHWDELAQDHGFAWSEVKTIPQIRFELSRSHRESGSSARGTLRVTPVFSYRNFEVTLNDRSTCELVPLTREIELRDPKAEETTLLSLFCENVPTPSAPPSELTQFGLVQIHRERRKINRLEIGAENLRALIEFLLSHAAKVETSLRSKQVQTSPIPEPFLQLQGLHLFPLRELHLAIVSGTSGVLLTGWTGFGAQNIPIQKLLPRLDLSLGTVDLGPEPMLDSQNDAQDLQSQDSQETNPAAAGFLPTRCLARLTALLSLGFETPTGIRFAQAQIPILAALFASDSILTKDPTTPSFEFKTETKTDAPFRALVEKFIQAREAKPKPPPQGFRGKLRHYQEEGFGWLSFLAETGFGGILADDMGLGKTIQLIAHLTDQYERFPKAPLSLVVLPKSLLFNWEEEIRKFSPNLKAAIFEGSQKRPLFSQIRGLHILLVTYNTLRQDIESLSQIPFHFVIADEAQAIKNANSLVHRACLQLQARHRLAVSGTPVENSVTDLFAIFDFVAPGLLSGRLKQKALQMSMQAQPNLTALGLALKPFILRRTKEEVLTDLPPKVEKVIHCKLSGAELKRYQSIRDFHKKRVQATVASHGLAKSGFAVLEGLLRLRQAASHPGLVDKKWINEPSAKLEAFMEQLQNVLDGGHKALVFSQFTGLLDIVEKKLKAVGIRFARIDGSFSSAQRRESVHEFQSNDRVEVFLISLKAGGTGLNLTAADYVFILDPWWNPAAESQAIDRAHRMGQKNRVFAYRMITKGTVEEKILGLQKTKRDLASALVSSDAGMLKTLSFEDIEALFS